MVFQYGGYAITCGSLLLTPSDIKNLVADIAPPPFSLQEAFVHGILRAATTDPGTQSFLKAKVATSFDAYNAAYGKWSTIIEKVHSRKRHP